MSVCVPEWKERGEREQRRGEEEGEDGEASRKGKKATVAFSSRSPPGLRLRTCAAPPPARPASGLTRPPPGLRLRTFAIPAPARSPAAAAFSPLLVGSCGRRPVCVCGPSFAAPPPHRQPSPC
jgi:hypothetical protein